MTPATALRRPHSAGDVVIRLVVVTGLVIDTVIHLQLAAQYQLAAPAGIGQGNLFRIEAVLALLAAVAVAALGSRISYGAAFLIAAGGLFALVLYRYVQVPAFGPVPAMYEPLWTTKKVVTLVAQAIAALGAIGGMFAFRQSTASE